jgi:hypothetical protein
VVTINDVDVLWRVVKGIIWMMTELHHPNSFEPQTGWYLG